MKHKFSVVVLAAAMTAAGLTGCLEKKTPNTSTKTTAATSAAQGSVDPVDNILDVDGEFVSESLELVKLKYADIPDAASGPELKISETEAKPGDIAKVTVSVTGAQDKWSMCGIHVAYPDILECQLDDKHDNSQNLNAQYEVGNAAAGNAGFVSMVCQPHFSEELDREKMNAVFFTTMFSDSNGGDGDIATFFFKIPDDAQAGTVYDLGFFYMESDMFRDLSGDLSFEKYAFTHMNGGKITVR